MADIFISYAREDQEKAGQLASALEAKGWTVFWDRTIPPGKAWREYIGAKLNAARCVIVAWSKTSVESEWVLDEADEGRKRKILVPILFDEIQPPLGFRSIHIGDLSSWKGDLDSTEFNQLADAISGIVGAPVDAKRDEEIPDEPPSFVTKILKKIVENKSALLLAVGTLALILVGGWFIWSKSTNDQVKMENPNNQDEACTNPDPPIKCLFR